MWGCSSPIKRRHITFHSFGVGSHSRVGANSVCGYFLCGDHRREITTAQGNHNGCGEV
jgi:hypothetical protein